MKIVDGNKAVSKIAYLFSEVCSIYPITPSSPMAENIDNLTHTDALNLFNTKPIVAEMESEAGAAGALHGALLSGSLDSTFTASQGLLLMIPNMYKIAGEKLPGVMHVASRSLATHALSIFGDHQDIYAVRSTGWCILASSSVEDAQNLAAVAHLSAIEASLPFVHFFDGFRTSHELNTINELKEEDLLSLINKDALDNFKKRALNINNNVTYGSSQTEDVYFQCMEAKNNDYNNVSNIVNNYMQKINSLANTDYKPFNYYGDPEATDVIIAMGSVCDTIKLYINEANKSGLKLGLVEVHLFRPFSKEYLVNVLPNTVKNIAVLDRAKEHGSREALFLDVFNALGDKNINIIGGRYGLSSKNTTPGMIKAVYDNLKNAKKDNFTIGIEDDVTNLSLKEEPFSLNSKVNEFKIYGFGSDGMVSASKEILDLIHQHQNKYVQGYFEYDSKKSGGVTVSHLRFDDEKIKMPFYVENPSLVVLTKEEYFQRFNVIKDIKDGGTLLINTIRNEEELNKFIPLEIKNIIVSKNINVYTVNASKIAFQNNIRGKINKVMEVIILKILGIDDALEIVSKSIKETFKNKGEDIVNANINALSSSLAQITKVNINLEESTSIPEPKDIYDVMEGRNGLALKVSECLDLSTGILPGGLSQREKRNISTLTPKWDSQKCIECGMCAMVCPHAVIRPSVTEDKSLGKPFIGKEEYNYMIGISNKDCTGCGLCIGICPTKALSFERKMEPSDFLFSKKNPDFINKFTIKGASLKEPKFAFPGACGGCGETPYIRLLTQLFGDNIVIANATGCSSIYGASSPCTPYSLPWANSLFEDNAEFAYGMHLSFLNKKEQIKNAMQKSLEVVDSHTKEIFSKYINDEITDEESLKLYDLVKDKEIPNEIKMLKDYIPNRNVWAIGGDGWAYDIGYNGIDHILHSGENVKILVLDTEVYSNTGGQASKSTKIGASARFADFGKKTNKKDLFKIASGIDNVYAATVSLGANMMHTINVFKEASEHQGPAIIIAYCPCIEHGINGGMVNSIKEEALAVECGYYLLLRSKDGKIFLDSKEPNFDKYDEFLSNENRYASLKIKDPNIAQELLNIQKENAKKRYIYYKEIKENE